MKVSWDEYSQYMEKIKSVPNHQPGIIYGSSYFMMAY
jgi:vancomycin permeability regulator SanA